MAARRRPNGSGGCPDPVRENSNPQPVSLHFSVRMPGRSAGTVFWGAGHHLAHGAVFPAAFRRVNGHDSGCGRRISNGRPNSPGTAPSGDSVPAGCQTSRRLLLQRRTRVHFWHGCPEHRRPGGGGGLCGPPACRNDGGAAAARTGGTGSHRITIRKIPLLFPVDDPKCGNNAENLRLHPSVRGVERICGTGSFRPERPPAGGCRRGRTSGAA